VSVTVTLRIGGQPLVAELDDEALAAIAAAVTPSAAEPTSPYVTIMEAAQLLRCKRQRVDDLLSAGKLRRFKEGRRTLLQRADLDDYVVKHHPRNCP
jgi:excisionase family DNA binding protein